METRVQKWGNSLAVRQQVGDESAQRFALARFEPLQIMKDGVVNICGRVAPMRALPMVALLALCLSHPAQAARELKNVKTYGNCQSQTQVNLFTDQSLYLMRCYADATSYIGFSSNKDMGSLSVILGQYRFA